MKFEIERKFLVDTAKWLSLKKPEGEYFRQGYIHKEAAKTVRVRLTDNAAYLTIKGISTGFTRPEFEYPIPQSEAKDLLDHFCDSELSKTRYKVDHQGKTWEVDVFHGDNEGLIVAEIELQSEDEEFTRPEWVTNEVSNDIRYFNSNLTENPYSGWTKKVD